MGCKAPNNSGGGYGMIVKGARHDGSGLMDMGGGMMAKGMMMGFMQAMMGKAGGKGCGKDKGKGKGKGEWKCDLCGFTNRQQNEVCGGNGPMGCKADKPSDWVCECGFVNKHMNKICGGHGPMGCDMPRPGLETEM